MDRCEFCGAMVIGGYDGCRSLFNEVTAQSLSSAAYFAVHRAAVDCYSLQHPEHFCVSAKSYAAHLSGLCVAIEYNRSVEVNAAIQKWLSGSIDLQKPKVLTQRGELTVLHIQNISDPKERARRIEEWCHNIWAAYAELHDVARSYVQAALAVRSKSD
jgi:uncharacterized protein DUF5946